MIKKVLLVLLLAVSVSGFAEDYAKFRFSVGPGLAWPKDKSVSGMQFGLINSQEKGREMLGWDWGLFATVTNNVKGSQGGIVCMTENSELVQGGIVNFGKKSKGTQLGIINIATDNDGIQIGLINIMDNGWLPVFILFNFSK